MLFRSLGRLASSSAIVGTRAMLLMAPFATQPPQEPTLQQLGVEPIGLCPAMFPRHGHTRGMDHVRLDPSRCGHHGFSTGYSSSKWALEGLSRSAAYVYADWGIRCNVIQPGFIETDLTASMSSNPLVKKMQSKAMNNTVLLRRSGKADEIAFTALFLASDESSYITGTDIVVDGGWFPQPRTSPTSAPITCSNSWIPRTKPNT